MFEFRCTICKRAQYSSANIIKPCIYCGSMEVILIGIAPANPQKDFTDEPEK